MPTTRHPLILAAIVVLLAGCAGETPSGSAPGTPTVTTSPPPAPSFTSSTATPRPTASPLVLPALEPIPAPTLLPAGAPFDVSWTELTGREAPSENGSLSQPFAWEPPTAVRWGTGAVVVYPGDVYGADRGPMIWWSPDLVTWRRAVPELVSSPTVVWASTVVVGGPGLAVLGGEVDEGAEITKARLWTSTDGAHWEEGTAPADARFLWGRPGRLVAFGRSTWLSADGRTWIEKGPSPFATIDTPGKLGALIVDDGDGAIVLVRHGSDAFTPVFRLGSDGSWAKLGQIDAWVGSAARGPTGIVALGDSGGDTPMSIAFTSADGRAWEVGTKVAPGFNLVGTATGYVAVTARSYYGGCAGSDPSQQIINTWTSADGLAWRKMPEDPALDHLDLPILLPDGDRLLAIGLAWAPEGGSSEFDNRSTPSVWASGPLVPPKGPGPKATASGCGS